MSICQADQTRLEPSNNLSNRSRESLAVLTLINKKADIVSTFLKVMSLKTTKSGGLLWFEGLQVALDRTFAHIERLGNFTEGEIHLPTFCL